MGSVVVEFEIAKIERSSGTQSRAALDDDAVEDYARRISGGEMPPPVIVYHDGDKYWLADGFHRVAAMLRAARARIDAEVRQGTRRDAILHSVGANADHGVRRTNADKRRAVETLLRDEEWSKWSNREIAKAARVHPSFVDRLRGEQEAVPTSGSE